MIVIKRIEKLKSCIHTLASDLDHGLLELDASMSEEAIRIKRELSQAKRIHSRIQGQLAQINENAEYSFSITENMFSELQRFFPESNIISSGIV